MQREMGLQGDVEVQRAGPLRLNTQIPGPVSLMGTFTWNLKKGNEEKSLRNLQENRKRSKTIRRPCLHDITCQTEVVFDAEILRSASTIKVPTENHREKNLDREKAPEGSRLNKNCRRHLGLDCGENLS